MTGMPEHAHRAAEHRQPRDRRVDHTSPGFVRPPDPEPECGARYGHNPDRCHQPRGHDGTHTNRWGTTWADNDPHNRHPEETP